MGTAILKNSEGTGVHALRDAIKSKIDKEVLQYLTIKLDRKKVDYLMDDLS